MKIPFSEQVFYTVNGIFLGFYLTFLCQHPKQWLHYFGRLAIALALWLVVDIVFILIRHALEDSEPEK